MLCASGVHVRACHRRRQYQVIALIIMIEKSPSMRYPEETLKIFHGGRERTNLPK